MNRIIQAGLAVILGMVFVGCAILENPAVSADDKTVKNQPQSGKVIRTLKRKGDVTRVLTYGDYMKGALWNDPSVIREGDTYVMYATANIGGKWGTVLPFRATSRDGLKWSMGEEPLLQLGKKGSFDEDSVETPSVVKFKGEYHMFYTGLVKGIVFNDYAIGHAVSADGKKWKRVSSKALLAPTGKFMRDWNGFHVAEPGAVVFNDKIYLYFHASGRREGGGSPGNQSVIGVSISENGYDFSEMKRVITQSQRYPATAAQQYLGYSTPSAEVVDGRVHLFYDVIASKPSWQQVALHHAVSDDGINFEQDSEPLLVRENLGWTKTEIRAPSTLYEDGRFRFWFAGHDIDNLGQAGIGYTEYVISQ